MMNISIKVSLHLMLSIVVGLGLGVSGVQAQSGSLEPPSTAVDGSGDPVATTQTQPSWDQDLPANERFKLVLGDDAVLDKETGLVWEKSPLTTMHSWRGARSRCLGRTVGGRRGWRLPSVHELASLVDPTNPTGNPDLPIGHLFSNVQSDFYWSSTTSAASPLQAWDVSFNIGLVNSNTKTIDLLVWCVRGGAFGPSEY